MQDIDQLLANNRSWAERTRDEDPRFFARLAEIQSPQYLWIGCADSRVPANQITGLLPGEIFVHRNIANMVVQSDLNCLSVLQYAVDVLQVRHVLVVGHYGCGGVGAAHDDRQVGLVDNWLRNIQAVAEKHAALLDTCVDREERIDLLCELNAVEQAHNVCRTTVLRQAWKRGQAVAVHAFVYGLRDGLLKETGFSADGTGALDTAYASALARIAG